MSVIIPVRNDAAAIPAAVASVLAQDYPRPLEVCLAVGPSDDDTASIAASLADGDNRVTVVDNPSGLTPTALNAAISHTSGDVVVRVDARSQLCDGYIRTAVATLAATGAANVGGTQKAVGSTAFEHAVAAAMGSWLGTGGARFRTGGDPGPTDTVYLGVFDRRWVDTVGGFADDLVRNQDYELNIRLCNAGGKVWFDPRLWVAYQPRGSLGALGRQYFEYGWWKAEVAQRHPASLRLRQVAPVAAAVALGVSAPLGVCDRRAWMVPGVYLSAVAIAAAQATASPGDDGHRAIGRLQQWARLAVIFPTMHLAWGSGFLASVATRKRRRL